MGKLLMERHERCHLKERERERQRGRGGEGDVEVCAMVSKPTLGEKQLRL